MKKIVVLVLIILASYSTGYSQGRYSGKLEIGYLYFGFRTIAVDDTSNLKGHDLENKQHGINLNLISGLTFKEKLLVGIGIGYLNFDLNYQGIQGVCVFSDFEFTPPTINKISFSLNVKIGSSQLFSQFWARNENKKDGIR